MLRMVRQIYPECEEGELGLEVGLGSELAKRNKEGRWVRESGESKE